MRQRIRALRGESRSGHLRAEGRVERVGERYRLTLSVHDGDATRERTIAADSCKDLAGAAAVALGLLIRNESAAASTGEQSPSGESGGSGETPGAGSSTPGSRNEPTAARAENDRTGGQPSEPRADDREPERAGASSSVGPSRGVRVFLRAPLASLDVGRLPKPGGGLGVGLGVGDARWRVLATGRILASETLWSENFENVGAHVARTRAELSVCRAWRSGALDAGPCLGVGVEYLTERGTGLGVSGRVAHTISIAATAAATARVYLTEWLALAGTATLGLETRQPHLVVGGLGEVRRLGLVWLSVGIGPEWIF